MRWISMVGAALALAACGVDSDALVEEADATQLMNGFQGGKVGQPTVTTTREICDCKTSPCSQSQRCLGPDGERVQTSASGNPEGHDPMWLILEHGDLFVQATEKDGFLVATDKGMENVIAILDNVEGEISEVVAYEELDAFTDELGVVSVGVYTREGGAFMMTDLTSFETGASGYDKR